MRNVRHGLLFLFGCFFIALAIFAFKLGLDPSPGWGKIRILSFTIGIGFIGVLVDLRFGQSWVEQIVPPLYNRLGLLINKTPHPRLEQSTRTHLLSLPISLISIFILVLYVWFTTAATWTTWPKSTDYYNLLANAFVKGKTSVDVEVNPQILALTDPYNPQARGDLEFLWDASLYNGRYYFYWGPAPALVITVIKLIHPLDIGDNLVTFAAAILLFLIQSVLLITLWKRFFEKLPGWTLMIGILLTGASGPITWMLHRPMIYEAAILSAQVFFMAGVYFAYRALESEQISYRSLIWASICWAAAIASRTIILLPILFVLTCILVRVILVHGLTWTDQTRKLLWALSIPLFIGAVGLGAYNFIRFGSVFDFGIEYQLTIFDNHKYEDVLFSSGYIPANTYNYLFNPVDKINPFPYFKAQPGVETMAFGKPVPDFFYAERVTGLIYIFPFLLFAFMPTTQQNGREMLRWLRIVLTGSVLIITASLLAYYYSTMRYLADITPSLITLSIIGFWSGYEATESDKFVRFVYSAAGILLAGISVLVPNLLALYSSEGIMHLSPQVLPALDLFYKSIFGR